MDLTLLAAELLDRLPANRTLGVTITDLRDGRAQARLRVTEHVSNVIGALHSSGVVALADAAALAAVLSLAPDEELARRLQPLGVQARLTFRRPVRGVALATCELDSESRAAVRNLFERQEDRARFTTVTIIDGEGSAAAAEGAFDWVARLASM